MNILLPEQQQYLQERGFELVKGVPHITAPFPYVALRDPRKDSIHSGITYHQTAFNSTEIMSNAHPSNKKENELVELIEKIVAEGKNDEGRSFTTQPGNKIKIYVIDNAWTAVAKKLCAKYITNS